LELFAWLSVAGADESEGGIGIATVFGAAMTGRYDSNDGKDCNSADICDTRGTTPTPYFLPSVSMRVNNSPIIIILRYYEIMK
jgi:hypothetical protein